MKSINHCHLLGTIYCGRICAAILFFVVCTFAGAQVLKDEQIADKFGFVDIYYQRIPDSVLGTGTDEEVETWGTGSLVIELDDVTEGMADRSLQYMWFRPTRNNRKPEHLVIGEPQREQYSKVWDWDARDMENVEYLASKYINMAFMKELRQQSPSGRVAFDVPTMYVYRPYDGGACRLLLPEGKYGISFRLYSGKRNWSIHAMDNNKVNLHVDPSVHYKIQLVFGVNTKPIVEMYKVNRQRIVGQAK